jgi:hypothetical protein
MMKEFGATLAEVGLLAVTFTNSITMEPVLVSAITVSTADASYMYLTRFEENSPVVTVIRGVPLDVV